MHDEVEDLISLEVEELQKGVAAIQHELDATRATLAEVSAPALFAAPARVVASKAAHYGSSSTKHGNHVQSRAREPMSQ